MENRMEHFSDNLNNSVVYLGRTVADYAVWDEMAWFSQGKYPDFPKKGMSRDSFQALGIDIVGIINDSGEILYQDDYSNPVGEHYPFRSWFLTYIQNSWPVKRQNEGGAELSSVIFSKENLSGVLVSHPILYHTTNETGNGYVVMGRYFKQPFLDELSIILDYPVFLVNETEAASHFSPKDTYGEISDVAVYVVNETSINSILRVHDPVSNDFLYFCITYPRNLYKEGMSTLISFLALILGIIAVFSVLSFFGLRFYYRYAEESARIAEEKSSSYQMIISEIEDGYFRTDQDGILETVSPSTVSMLGYNNPEDVIGKPLSDFYQNPDERSILRKELFMHKHLKNQPLVLKRIDGSLVYVTAHAHLTYDKDGTVNGIEGIAHDNTDVLKAKKTAHEGESFYRLIFESANIGLFESNAKGDILLVNPVFATMFGYRGPEQMKQEGVSLPDTLGLDLNQYERLKGELKTRGSVKNMEVPLLKKDGTPVWLNMNIVVIKDFSDKAVVIIGTAIDITEKKTIESSLIESQEKFKSLFYFSPVAIFVYDTDGKVLDSNSAAISLFGTSKKSIPESDPFFFLRYFTDEEKESLNTGALVKTEILMDFDQLRGKYDIPSDRSGIVYLDLMVTPIPGSDYHTRWFLTQITDITGRKKSEIARIIATERLKEAEVIARLGHWELDLKKNVMFWSDEVYFIFEKEPVDYTPTFESFREMVHPEDRRIFSETFHHHLFDNAIFDIIFRINVRDSRIKYVRGVSRIQWDEKGNPIRSLGIIHDITTTRLNELALRESELKYRQVFSNVSLGLILFEFTDDGEPGRIIDLNPKAQDMIQKTMLDMLITQNNIKTILPIGNSLAGYIRKHTSGDADICTFKSGIIRRDGEILPVQVTLDIYHLDKKVVGLAIIEDITMKNQYENERIKLIQQIERNLAELAILNDGIRNPLTVIMLLVDELEKEISEPVIVQIKIINELIHQLDQRWMESDIILRFLQKHHNIQFEE